MKILLVNYVLEIAPHVLISQGNVLCHVPMAPISMKTAYVLFVRLTVSFVMPLTIVQAVWMDFL
jgi:hypothetical protein